MLGLVRQTRFNELQKEYNELKLRLDNCREIELKNRILSNELQSSRVELAEVKSKLREQAEADFFFISAKIQKKLLEEPKENVQDLKLQQMASQAQLGQMQTAWNSLSASAD